MNPLQRLVIVEIFMFYKINQGVIVISISEYIIKLQVQPNWCQVGEILYLALCIKLVCGFYNKSGQDKLLSENNLTFGNVLEAALAS